MIVPLANAWLEEKQKLQQLLNKAEADLIKERQEREQLEKEVKRLTREASQQKFRTGHYEIALKHTVDALKFYAGNFPDDDLGNWQERVCEDEGDQARSVLDSLTTLGIIKPEENDDDLDAA